MTAPTLACCRLAWGLHLMNVCHHLQGHVHVVLKEAAPRQRVASADRLIRNSADPTSDAEGLQ